MRPLPQGRLRLTEPGASAMLQGDSDSEALLIRSREAGKVARVKSKEWVDETRGDAGFFLPAAHAGRSVARRRRG